MAQERTAEEWGRAAVEVPGFLWMPGMVVGTADGWVQIDTLDGGLPAVLRYDRWCEGAFAAWVGGSALSINPDDPATWGCLLALLGASQIVLHPDGEWEVMVPDPNGDAWGYGSTIGRACIAAAEAFGRWPGAGGA